MTDPRPSVAVRVRRRARAAGARALAGLDRRVLAPRGLRLVRDRDVDLVESGYHSPIPDWRSLPPSTWTDPSPMPGVDWDAAPAVELLEGVLAGPLAEHRPPVVPGVDDATQTALQAFYNSLDAATLHAMLRHVRPRRVIELGSGVSTLVMLQALARNREDGAPSTLDVFDPYPRLPTERGLDGAGTLHRTAAEHVAAERFATLEAGDVLFVDTTHTVRVGGDVVRIMLDVLPRLAPGVIVHIHDILLPYEYHRLWFESGWYWQEQYVVQAVLQDNPHWEVVLPNHQLHREHADVVRHRVPTFVEGSQPSALWLRRRVPGEDPTVPLAGRLRAPR
ncbi:MAG: class I SAM-dependent methyltransferase [Solirubrobacteraceae bacterium]